MLFNFLPPSPRLLRLLILGAWLWGVMFGVLPSGGFLSETKKRLKAEFQTSSSLDWSAQESGVLAHLSSVFFLDREHGWIAGSNGTILVTEDGGSKWRRVPLESRELLRDVFFLNAQRGLVLGEYSLFNRPNNSPKERSFLLASVDRGASWEGALLAPIKPNDPKDYQGDGLLRLLFADERTGWACGETGLILSTKDGGQNWHTQISPTRKLLYGMTAVSDKQAWVVGASGVVLRTVDGGQQWNEQLSNTMQTLRAVHFIDSKRGWAVGAGGTIISTVNGGSRWRAQSSDVVDDLNSVFFTSASEGWAAGDHGALLHTRDGGMTWERTALKTRSNFTRLIFIAPDCGWVVGTNGAVFKYQPTDGAPRPALKNPKSGN